MKNIPVSYTHLGVLVFSDFMFTFVLHYNI